MPLAIPRPFVAVENAVEVKIHALADGITSEMINTLHFHTANVHPTQADVDNCASWTEHFIDSFYKPLVNNLVIMTLIEAKGMDVQGASEGQRVINIAGTSAGNPDRAVIAPLITWRTGLGGRSFHGRLYMYLPSQQDMTPRGPTPGFRTLATTNMNAAIADAAGGLYPLAVASKALGDITNITTAVLSNKLTYQKRRDINRGS